MRSQLQRKVNSELHADPRGVCWPRRLLAEPDEGKRALAWLNTHASVAVLVDAADELAAFAEAYRDRPIAVTDLELRTIRDRFDLLTDRRAEPLGPRVGAALLIDGFVYRSGKRSEIKVSPESAYLSRTLDSDHPYWPEAREADAESFPDKMARLTATLQAQMARARRSMLKSAPSWRTSAMTGDGRALTSQNAISSEQASTSQNVISNAGSNDLRLHRFREQAVVLDADVATLIGVETRALNQQVKRNADKFGDDFAFQLTLEEIDVLKSQNVTSKRGRGGSQWAPWVFTEHGVVIAATVLKSPQASVASFVGEPRSAHGMKLLTDGYLVPKSEQRAKFEIPCGAGLQL